MLASSLSGVSKFVPLPLSRAKAPAWVRGAVGLVAARAAANECFAHYDVAELTIGLATNRCHGIVGSGE